MTVQTEPAVPGWVDRELYPFRSHDVESWTKGSSIIWTRGLPRARLARSSWSMAHPPGRSNGGVW